MPNRAIIHGCLVAIDCVGVLIVGEAGVGKTAVSLELERLGHNFIADDAVLIRRIYNQIIGSAPPETAGRLAVRGIGIVKRIPKGSELSCSIDLVVQLAEVNKTLPEMRIDEMLDGIPRTRLDVSKSTARQIEAIALKMDGES